MKICKHCGVEFEPPTKGYSIGNVCRVCKNGLYRYGLDRNQQITILESQNHRCALCEEPVALHCGDNSDGVIDHCHESSKIRGVLCSPCNLILGKIEQTNYQGALNFAKNLHNYLSPK